MDEILVSHLIDPVALRADDFSGFFQSRTQALLARIERAMGKSVVRDMVEPDGVEEVEYETEEAMA